jgi:glycosyltransferase involved in cell wall biosynthesis
MTNSRNVTVIVPCYNAQGCLEKSLRSLFSQSLQGLEIIVVDDCSTDATSEIVARLSEEYDDLVYLRLPENKGVHEARLAGLKKATSPWIGFLDADDIALPHMYQRMYEAGVQNGVDIVVCGSLRVTFEGKRISHKVIYPENRKISENLFDKFCRWEFGSGAVWNKLYRHETITPYQDLHFDWRQNCNEDLLLNIGCFLDASSVYLLKDVLHQYVENPYSATAKMKNTKGYIQTYRAYALAISLYAGRDVEIFEKITELYRRQLGFSCYQIGSLKDLHQVHREEIEEAINLIKDIYPLGLALIASRQVATPLSIRAIVDKVLKKFGARIYSGW